MIDADRLRLGEQMELASLSVKSAAQNVLMLTVSLSTEGCQGHVAPLRSAHGSLQDALRSLSHGTEIAGRELAKKLESDLSEQILPGHAEPTA